MKNSWSKDEDEILKRYYTIIGSDVVAMLPNRNRESIRKRASYFSLNAGRMGRKPALKWELEEDRMVRDLYPIYGEGIAKYLVNKTPENVTARARLLGVLVGRAIKPRKQEPLCQK